MADTEKKLAISVELHEAEKDDNNKDNDSYNNFDPSDHAITENEKKQQDVTTDTSKKENDDDNDNDSDPAQMSETRMRQKSIKERKQKLRVVVDDMWTESTRNVLGGSNKDLTNGDGKKLTAHNSSLINRVTSILIDELNDDTQQFETCIITLPKSPICALLLMESVGIFQTLEKVNQFSIIATILVTIIVQTAAGGTLFVKQIYSDVDSDYEASDGLLNLVVISFVVIYLSQDCAQIYKMVILLRWMHNAGKLVRHSAVLITIYLITNALFYVFLMYYSVVELMITDDIALKLQAAVAVYFILELDDWLYSVTIEPLKILDEEIFDLQIKGGVGSRNRRFKKVTYWFWGVFAFLVIVQFVMFVGRVQDSITFANSNNDDGDSTCSCCCNR